jgi:hypothetical protein
MNKLFETTIHVLIIWILTMAALGITIGMYKYLTKPSVAVVSK